VYVLLGLLALVNIGRAILKGVKKPIRNYMLKRMQKQYRKEVAAWAHSPW
jgi:hypothetical protein